MEASSPTSNTAGVKREITDITASNGTSGADATDDRSPPSKRSRTDDSGTEAGGHPLKNEPLTNGQGTGNGEDEDDYGLDLSEDESNEKDKENAHRKNNSEIGKGVVNGGESVENKGGARDEKVDKGDEKDDVKDSETGAGVEAETSKSEEADADADVDDNQDAVAMDTHTEANDDKTDGRNDEQDNVSDGVREQRDESESVSRVESEEVPRSVSESSEMQSTTNAHDEKNGAKVEHNGDGEDHMVNGVLDVPQSDTHSHMSDGNVSESHNDAYTDAQSDSQQPGTEHDQYDEDHDIDVRELRFKSLDGTMRTLWKNGDAWPFHLPVDDVALNIPDYYKIITNPMDMTQISNKLKERAYDSVEDFQDDFELMFRNCRMYNKPESDIARMVGNLETAYKKQMNKMPSEAELIAKHRAKQEKRSTKKAAKRANKNRARGAKALAARSTAPAVSDTGLTANKISVMKLKERQGGDSTGLPMARMQSVDSFGVRRASRMSLGGIEPASDINLYERALDNRPARDRRAVVPLVAEMETNVRHKLTVQLKYCGKILSEFLHKKYYPRAWPFVVPVDPVLLMLPDYFKIIKKPMDLSTMQKKYDNREYASAEEFASDMRLMFANCYRYNKPGQDVYELGKKLSADFEQRFDRRPDEPVAPPREKKVKRLHSNASHSVGGGGSHSRSHQRQEYYADEYDDEPEEDEEAEEPFATQGELAHMEQLKKMQEMVATLQSNIEALTRTSSIQTSTAVSRRGSNHPTTAAAKKGKQAALSKRNTSTNHSKVTNTHHSTTNTNTAAKKRANPLPKPQPPAPQGKPRDDIKPMTFMEKKTLSLNINRLPGNRIAKLVSIIQTCIPELANCPAAELEIDIDSLDPLTLRELEKYVNSAMAETAQPPKKQAAKRAPARRKAPPKKQASSGAGAQGRGGGGGANQQANRGQSKAGSGYLSESQRMRRGGSSSSSSSNSSSGSSSSDSSGSDSESEAEVAPSSRGRGTGGKGSARPSSATGTKSGLPGANTNRRPPLNSVSSITKNSTSNTSPSPGINAGIQLAPGPPPKPKESKLLLGEAARTSQQPRANALKMVPSASTMSSIKPGSKPAIKVGNVNAWSSLATGGSSGNTPKGTSPATGNSPATGSQRIGNSASPADGSGDRLNEYRKKALLKSSQEKGSEGVSASRQHSGVALSRHGSVGAVGATGARSPNTQSADPTLGAHSPNGQPTKTNGSASVLEDAVQVKVDSDTGTDAKDNTTAADAETVSTDLDERAKRREEERRRRAQEANKEQSTAAHDGISGEALEESLFMFG